MVIAYLAFGIVFVSAKIVLQQRVTYNTIYMDPVSYTHLDVYKRQTFVFIARLSASAVRRTDRSRDRAARHALRPATCSLFELRLEDIHDLLHRLDLQIGPLSQILYRKLQHALGRIAADSLELILSLIHICTSASRRLSAGA